MRRVASSLIVALLLLSLFASTLKVQIARAEPGTIYIRADGSIDPSTAPIQRNGSLYTLTGNITSSTDGIIIQKSNITIDGADHTLNGIYASGNGFDLASVSNVTVKNTTITNFRDGIWLFLSFGNSVSGNSITNTSYAGIELRYSNYNSVSGNNITANSYYGIMLASFSNYNSVSGNNITANSYYGIMLGDSSNCSVVGNVFSNDGLIVYPPFGNVVSNNTVNGKPLVYLEDASDLTITDAGQVVLINCNRISVEKLNLSHTDIAFELWNTNNTIISGNNITNNYGGMWFVYSFSNNVSGNNITDNTLVGIVLGYSFGNSVSGNNISNKGGYAIWLAQSSGNRIFHNNFLNNTYQYVSDLQSFNTWDDGYPSGGNYWSDFSSVDQKSGPYQNETGSDGIGDTPYVNANNTDRYPLMAPLRTFDAGTWNNVSYSVDIVSNSTLSIFRFNATAKTLTFNVTGTNGTTGFCRVVIPKGLMWTNTNAEWALTVNGTLIGDRSIANDTDNTYIYFTYHHSTESVQIQSTGAVPEFQPFMLIPLLMVIALFGVILFKIKRNVRK